jgi:hypothetical protein
MKNELLLCLALFLISTGSGYSQALGDANNNGSIDIVDALITAQYYVGLNPQNFFLQAADVNCNGTVDIVDALVIARFYVGLINQFSCAQTPAGTAEPTPAPTAASGIIPLLPLYSFDWVLSGAPDTNKNVKVIDIDAFNATAETVASFKSKGTIVIGYISVGSREDWRPDINLIPADCIGNDYPGWPGEKFLDIRQMSKLTPMITSRLDMIKSKGFDGVEPDNMDCFENNTGFPLSQQDGINYALWLASLAHSRGLSIGQKNASEIASAIVNVYDWALLEDGFGDGFYTDFFSYINLNKAVFDTEYSDNNLSTYCGQAASARVTLIRKNLDLDNWIQTCN